MRSLCIIPVFNQEKELAGLLERCRRDACCDEILLVDDGSTDRSREIIEKSGFPFLRIEDRRGIGHALILGTKYAILHGFDIVMHLAGNGKMQPSEMHRVLNPLLENRADYVWGSRFLHGGEFVNAPTFRKYAIPLVFNQLPWLFTGCRVTDATCGYRAYRVDLLEKICKGWDHPWLYKYEFEYFVLAKVLLSTARWLEVPISMVYPKGRKDYSKITPFISWWSMLKPWLIVGLGLEPLPASLGLPLPGPHPTNHK